MVSPVFDVARRLAVADVSGQVVGQITEQDLPAAGAARVAALAEGGVEVLICGGISMPLAQMVQGAGVQVVPQICGPVKEVLAAFARDELYAGPLRMPGCRRRLRARARWGARGGRRRMGQGGWAP